MITFPVQFVMWYYIFIQLEWFQTYSRYQISLTVILWKKTLWLVKRVRVFYFSAEYLVTLL